MTKITNKEQVLEFIKDVDKPICDSCELKGDKCPLDKIKKELELDRTMFCKFYR